MTKYFRKPVPEEVDVKFVADSGICFLPTYRVTDKDGKEQLMGEELLDELYVPASEYEPLCNISHEELIEKYGYAVIVWTVNDVLDCDSRLTEEEARKILYQVCIANHEADRGVTWDTFTETIHRMIPDIDARGPRKEEEDE